MGGNASFKDRYVTGRSQPRDEDVGGAGASAGDGRTASGNAGAHHGIAAQQARRPSDIQAVAQIPSGRRGPATERQPGYGASRAGRQGSDRYLCTGKAGNLDAWQGGRQKRRGAAQFAMLKRLGVVRSARSIGGAGQAGQRHARIANAAELSGLHIARHHRHRRQQCRQHGHEAEEGSHTRPERQVTARVQEGRGIRHRAIIGRARQKPSP